MKKRNTFFKTALLLMMCYTPSLHAQFECVDILYVSLPPSLQYTLFPEDLLTEGDLNGYTATLSQSEFTCHDLGPNNVTLTIFENGDPVFSCMANVIVEDKLSPVAVCDAEATVVLDENGERVLTFADIDDGSYDGCGPITYSISPTVLDCESDNPTLVTLVITDGSGNTSACVIDVTWEPYPDPNPNLACNAQVIVTLAFGEQATITSDMILEGGPYGCAGQYEVTILENLIPRPEPIVTLDDTNKVLLAQVTDLNTDMSCWGELIVVGIPGCDPVFTICDTECHSAPIGDCNSGHTDTDHVEWPCDIVIETNCQNAEFTITPENLYAEGWAVAADTAPYIVNEYCYSLAKVYNDLVFITDEGKRVERTWTILNWATGEIWEYEQIITINIESLFICDTLPWNAPLGDCDSGHTDTDDIEWPADITVSTSFVTPDDLALNPDVNPMDVRPTLSAMCNEIAVVYLDEVFFVNDSTQRIERTWGVFDFYTSQIWEYTQVIMVQDNDGRGSICIIRDNGDPVTGVTLRPGIMTNDSGCYRFDEIEGVVVEPSKESAQSAGVNIADKVLLLEYLLGITELSPYQRLAADVNQSASVSAIDLVILDKLIEGIEVPELDQVWKFFERTSHLPSVDLTGTTLGHTFIGIKLGDIDNSLRLPGSTPLEQVQLTIEDEILNHKEEYMVPFNLNENTRLSGFSVRLNRIAADIKFLSVSTPFLPGFSMDEHVKITEDQVTITWIAPNEYLASGVAVAAGLPLFVLQIEPMENGILSTSIALEENYDHVMKSTLNPVAEVITIGWDNLIISSVLNPGQVNTLEFYPNPATEEIYFQGFQPMDQGVVSIIDATGRILSTTPLQSSLETHWLESGIYYLTVKLNNGEVYNAPLIKVKS